MSVEPLPMPDGPATIADIRAAMQQAEEAAAPPADAAAPAAAPAADRKVKRGGPITDPAAPLPPVRLVAREMIDVPVDMPVTCLGLRGAVYYYLDALHQFRELKPDQHGRTYILSLFGPELGWLLEQWGRKDRKGNPTGGLHTDIASNVLMRGCAIAGIIDPVQQVRGTGAWVDEAGRLVLHLGDVVWAEDRYQRPSRYGQYIYPALPPMQRPCPDAVNGDTAAEVLRLLETWTWADPFMAHLALGWIGQGFLAGAVRWRTHAILDGERGSGKSSLQDLMKGLFGRWLVDASNVTEAGLRQQLQGKAQPVFIDEFEAGQAPAKKAAVVELLRQASSGGVALRGGDNHVGHSFTVRFPAIVSSIAPVPLLPQDESRMVRLKLLALPPGARRPDLSPARLAPMGQRLMRRMVDQWPRWGATLAIYSRMLESEAGADARTQDTLGTLLAAADMLLWGSVPEDEHAQDMVARLIAMIAPTRAEAVEDQQRCLQHLLAMPVMRGSGLQRTVASWAVQSMAINEGGFADDTRRREARDALGSMGLRVMGTDPGGSLMDNRALDADRIDVNRLVLFVANSHPALERAFLGSPWPGGAGGDGAWGAVLRRLDGARASPVPVRAGGQRQRGTLLPIGPHLDWDGA